MKSVTYSKRFRLDVIGDTVKVYPPRRSDAYHMTVAVWTPEKGLTDVEGRLDATPHMRRWLAVECACAFTEAYAPA